MSKKEKFSECERCGAEISIKDRTTIIRYNEHGIPGEVVNGYDCPECGKKVRDDKHN